MARLFQRLRRTGVLMALAFGLAVLAAIATPLLGDELASGRSDNSEILIAESENGGG